MRRSARYHAVSVIRQVWRHPSNRGRRLRAVGRAIAWQIRKRLRPAVVDLPYMGLTLRGHPDSNAASNVVYFTERFDPDEMTVIEAVLRPGDVFVDAGANIGAYTLLAATLVGDTGTVIAYEPHPVAASRLRENVEHNHLDQVVVREAAIGQRSGVVDFLAHFDVANSILTPTDAGEPTVAVDVVTLDEDLDGRPVAVAKLDLEGFEVQALKGATSRLAAADPPIWLVEIMEWQLRKAGDSTAALVDLFAAHGFRLHRYDTATGRMVPVAGADTSTTTGNLWAIADGHAARIDALLDAHRRDAHAPNINTSHSS